MLAKLRELVDDLRRSQSEYDRKAAFHPGGDIPAARCQGKAQAFGEASDRILKIIEENDTEE